jgi:hypothetical protein
MSKILWTLPFPSSSGNTWFSQFPKLNSAVIVEGCDEEGETITLRIVFEKVEAYKCTYYMALTPEMQIAYDKIVDLGETSWLTKVKNQLRRFGDLVLSSPSHGPLDQLAHLMINFDDGPCYEFICRNFRVEQIPTDPERWKVQTQPT